MIFAFALLAVALATQPFQSPKEKRTPENSSAQAAPHAEDSAKANEQPPKNSPLPTSQASSQSSQTQTTATNDDIEVQRKIEVFTGGLVIVGLLQAAVMFLTWLVYCRQAKIMARQAHEMKRQRGFMRLQWKAMGTQAEHMEGQLAEMAVQSGTLKESVNVARASANAANKSADAFLNAERAWVMVDVTCEHGSEMETTSSNGDVSTGLADTTIKYKNTGHSPGWITEKVIKLAVLPKPLPKELELDDPKTVISELEPISPDEAKEEKQGLMICPGRHSPLGRTVLAVYGRISYRDIFDEKRETWFCYRVEGWKNARRLRRMEEYPEYNRNT